MIRMLRKRGFTNSQRVTVLAKSDADFLAKAAKKDGFPRVLVKPQEVAKGKNVYHVVVGVKPKGGVAEIETFFNRHE
jgi:hypothetical protein